MLNGCIGLIVDKAQDEVHFSSMYAELCAKLAVTPFEGLEGDNRAKLFRTVRRGGGSSVSGV